MTTTEQLIEQIEFIPVPGAAATPGSDLPYVTHLGVLHLLGKKLQCYRLNDGRAVFDADDVGDFFEFEGE